MPGLLELACAVVICSADWFLLSRVLYWFMHLDPAIDTAIEHDSRLSLISKKKVHLSLITASTDALPRGAGNFSTIFSGKMFIPFSDFTRSLLKRTRMNVGTLPELFSHRPWSLDLKFISQVESF